LKDVEDGLYFDGYMRTWWPCNVR